MHELARALIANSAFAPAEDILEGIPVSLVQTKPAAAAGCAPHSIYDEVWHMAFWQRISLDWIEGRATAYPEHAAEGFPREASEGWEALRLRFLAGVREATAAVEDGGHLDHLVACPRPHEPQRTMTAREQLESLAAHNAYHLGRVVLLRQLLGIWPPPSGGETW